MNTRHFIVAWLVGLVFAAAAAARAESYDVAIPLHDGKIELSDLSSEICRQLHLPSFPLGGGSIKVTGFAGSLFVRSLNAGLGEGCQIRIEGDHLFLHVDPARLPQSVPEAKAAVRRAVAADFPDATARQEKHYGLFMPAHIDVNRPIVVLLHGLDDGRYTMEPIGNALAADGYQVAYFVYPADGPLDDAAASVAKDLHDVQRANPGIKIDLIGYSMGGLVARRYVEGHDYAGGVDRLIEVGTPNHGSDWASFEPALAAHEQIQEARFEKGWSPTWAITEGLSEATADITPGSIFLHRLNKLPRRAGVKYTIIAGDKNIFAAIGAGIAGDAAGDVPGKNPVSQAIRLGLHLAASNLDSTTAPGDGPVSLHGAKLDGVTDFVVVHADHIALAQSETGKPPAALAIIEDRLSQSKAP